MSVNIIEMRNITKRFPGIIANDNITLELRKGEIHALLGENGAGKSTLMSVLFGLYQQDEGEILLNGEPIKVTSPNDANNYGIGMVHQHFKLVDVFTILDNIILGVEPNKIGLLDRKVAYQKLKELSKKYELDVDLKQKVMNVTVGMQQRTEILKMLYRENDILIFDEPTAVLTPQEINQLMITMKNLANEGKSIIFITHKLDEIMSVCDRVTVLQRGKHIGTVDVKDTTKEQLSKMMVGRDVTFTIEKEPQQLKEDVLVVKDLVVVSPFTKKHIVDNVSFKVKGGEIVSIAGVDGNGQSELAYAISGLIKPKSGHIYLDGKDIVNESVRYRNDHGLSHIPEDRHRYALILNDTLAHNLNLKKYHQKPYQNRGIINEKEINKYGESLIEKFDIRSGQGIKTLAGSMSGGNQQKAVIAREIDKGSNLLLAVQTVRGLDVGAVEFAHRQILKERDLGRAVLLISFELDEVMSVSDRILVMYEGKIVGDLNPNEITVEELGLYMAGSKRDEIQEVHLLLESTPITSKEGSTFHKPNKKSAYFKFYNKQHQRNRGDRL